MAKKRRRMPPLRVTPIFPKPLEIKGTCASEAPLDASELRTIHLLKLVVYPPLFHKLYTPPENQVIWNPKKMEVWKMMFKFQVNQPLVFGGGYPSHKYDVVRATSDLLEISWRRDCSKSEGEAEAMLNCQGMSMSIV